MVFGLTQIVPLLMTMDLLIEMNNFDYYSFVVFVSLRDQARVDLVSLPYYTLIRIDCHVVHTFHAVAVGAEPHDHAAPAAQPVNVAVHGVHEL